MSTWVTRFRRPAVALPQQLVPVRSRVLASALDLLVIGGWLGVLSVAAAVVRRGRPDDQGRAEQRGIGTSARTLLAVDVAVFAATVLPTGLYLGLTEAGVGQASSGKRLLGLTVVSNRTGGRPDPGRVALRTAVKLLPWQLAHVAVTRMNLKVSQPGLTWSTYVCSLAVPAVSVALALRDPAGRALHDRIAGTRVVAASVSTR